jgi:rhodanese-related sulfurtransferase
MKTLRQRVKQGLPAISLALVTLFVCAETAQGQSTPTIFEANLGETNPITPEISTKQLQAILASGTEPVLDVRSRLEYAIAHIPGAINIPELEVAEIMSRYPNPGTQMTLTCNGPFCGKSKRTSEELVLAGYYNVKRYQLGMPVWRALGNTVQTDLAGFLYMYRGDRTTVFVDARTPEEFHARTVRCAVNIRAGEATAANDDGRLPNWDKGSRVVVFANTPAEARQVALEIARKAYWNSSYFGGELLELKQNHLLKRYREDSERRCPGPQ